MLIHGEKSCSESSAINYRRNCEKNDVYQKQSNVYQKGARLDIFLSNVVYLIFFPQRNIKSSRAIQPAVKDVR